jgi:hypothetical protein
MPRNRLSDLRSTLAAISAKDTVRAHSRNSPTFIATNPAAPARISNIKLPPIAIPVIATDTGAVRSSPVATIAPITQSAHDANPRIIAPENVSTAATLSPVERFTLMRQPHNLPSTARINKITNSNPNPPLG